MENKTETMIAQESKKEAEEVMSFLEELDESRKKEFLAFVLGARLMKRIATSKEEERTA